jgi:fatty acid-binding protein DegV
MTVVWGEKQYLDGKELTAEEFYKELKVNPIHPTTSQPTPKDFLTAYEI